MSTTALIVGDPHFPFVNKRSLLAVYSQIKYRQPDVIVQVGDLFDFVSFSPFPNKRQFILAKDELQQGREAASKFWINCQKIAPNAKCHQLRGNHDERPLKTLARKGAAEFEPMVSCKIDEMFSFPGVITQPDERTELILKVAGFDIMFMHGFFLKPLQHTRENQMCTALGHTHYGYTAFVPQKDKVLWELNAGYIADREAFPLSYSKQRAVSKSVQGFGWIDKNGPRFISFPWR